MIKTYPTDLCNNYIFLSVKLQIVDLKMSVGIADLPLHSGRVPSWLAELMKKLSKAILEVLVLEYGSREVVRRLGDPLWFQALNNLIGMDWDSSGSTTVTLGILKEVTWSNELGVIVLGGKGSRAKNTINEVDYAVEKLGLPTSAREELKRSSILSAKVDTSLLQDNYQLYHHSLIVSEKGLWTVVQQGMNLELKMARRYHWVSEDLNSYVVEPHSAIASNSKSKVLNLVAIEAEGARKTILDVVREPPQKTINRLYEAIALLKGVKPLTSWLRKDLLKAHSLRVKYYKPIRVTRVLKENLKRIYEAYPKSIEETLLVKGVGPLTFRALTLISDLIYGEPPSERDPVTHPFDPFLHSYAFGGKDGVPYPVNKSRMEEVIQILENAIEKAKLGEYERLKALKRLKSIMRER